MSGDDRTGALQPEYALGGDDLTEPQQSEYALTNDSFNPRSITNTTYSSENTGGAPETEYGVAGDLAGESTTLVPSPASATPTTAMAQAMESGPTVEEWAEIAGFPK